MAEKKIGSMKKMVFVIISGLLAAHAATLIWGLLTHWTQVNLVFLDMVVGIIVGLFIRRAADSAKTKYIITALLITLWGILLGYIFNTVIFAATELHHGYWATYKLQGFAHTLELIVQNMTIPDVLSIIAGLVCAAVLSVHGKKDKV